MKIRCVVLFPSRQQLSSEFSSLSEATLPRTQAVQTGRVVLVREGGSVPNCCHIHKIEKWGKIENILLKIPEGQLSQGVLLDVTLEADLVVRKGSWS